MQNHLFTSHDQINTVHQGFRHVVILGAGASRACCDRNPEKNKKIMPLMDDLISVIDISDELNESGYEFESTNFEFIFSKLHKEKKNHHLLRSIEKKIYDYFSSLKLPDVPTIYDYLLLSLRSKDLIATFNWDPFLWQAFMRNYKKIKNLPKLVFLHGNVAIGISKETGTFGPSDERYFNKKTGKPFNPIKLLYPIEKKDYTSDDFINDQWICLSSYLTSPARVTIFGYSAPKTDVEAISILEKAWETNKSKKFTQIEIIDIEKKEKIYDKWKNFIFSHHYETHDDFFSSSLTMFPRRTGEVYEANKLKGKWYAENYPLMTDDFESLWNWYEPLIEKEK